ncbi:hypothetical protein Asp14428_77260 [Actinoplanes sp. NBRC 14428]|nr:hypothetical protein Asp14428_77260 [Actinoplanes sp. NBRC 14428]
MSDPVPLVAAAIAFLALAPKTVQLVRDPRNPALRATCGVLGSLGLAQIVAWQPSYHAIGQLTGVPNLARYLMHLCALVAAAVVQSLFLHLNDPATARTRARWRWLLLAVVAVVMGISFHLADFAVEDARTFADRYATAPYMREYMLGFLAYLALAMVDIMRMSLRYSRRLPPSALRFGLRVLALGALDGLLYVIHKTTFILVAARGVDVPWPEAPTAQFLISLGIALVSSGLVIPSVAKVLVAARQWPGSYRLYRDMLPLWQALYALDNSVNLNPPGRRPPLSTLDIEMYRRIIEILDSIREHSAYLDRDASEAASRAALEAGLPPGEARAIGDAAAIAAMIDYVSRTAPADRVPAAGGDADTLVLAEEHDTEAARRLAAISRAFAGSPIVRAQREAAGAAGR